MFEYELHQVRAAELIREADNYRLAREARAARKSRRPQGGSDSQDAEGRVSTHRPRRHRAARTA
ncbi:hypothetical protein [Streptomyces longispororuber]|uniref:hypothetical protein n=1 Tax=Streptomyces longispororuber TaxID=68230 RepID=UPI0021099563|nr:hypothetical protein [Streptomyces longispororuber]MCQ4206705.1 hypothetical protein [Streptomyces longispororuber]